MTSAIRADLAEAHRQSLQHVASPGARLDAERRLQIAAAATQGYLAAEPPPPWVRPFADPALDVAFRLARYAGTITQEWYEQVITEGMHPLEWVEIVGIVVATVPPLAFARAAGRALPEFPPSVAGQPHGREAAELAPATLNWVPVAAPADTTASVVQALSALPGEWDNMWRLAEAQYMSDAQMVDPLWNRGTLSRPQMELAAGRISRVRECFF
ncbi:MAG: hypothetical protein KAY11_15190 [Ilumatobacteraceae bacterium]|jgi:hypothetical protein|nr:hypothetical protein [Ilumatobacteraceae bacterium]MBP7891009.1 hypothetical protein [Ilumatobacteraceae bacterium]MBP8210910.1 hypothetical protein [Ilumatobacteraceae bacterium]HQY16754.1 hypothetical protein [Ilumatobacteraceae bacterium]